MTTKEKDMPTDTAIEVLTELLRLYDWRFELAKEEAATQVISQQRIQKQRIGKLKADLRQYGTEKKAAWERARKVIEAASAGAEHCRGCGQSWDACVDLKLRGAFCCYGCAHVFVAAPADPQPELNFAPPNSTRTVAVTLKRVDDPPTLGIDAQPEAPSVPMESATERVRRVAERIATWLPPRLLSSAAQRADYIAEMLTEEFGKGDGT
jgi:hypothetical protein